MKRICMLALLTSALLTGLQCAFSQTYWQNDGLPIRQGTHLGWNGCAISAGSDLAIFYYHAKRDGTRDVYGQRIQSNGNFRWNNNGILISGNLSEQRAPVAKAYDDGSTLVVWEDYAHGRYRDLVAQRYDINGNPLWTPTEGVPIVTAAHDQYQPMIAIDEQDYAFIAFTDDRLTNGDEVTLGAYAQILTPDGEIIGPDDGIELVDRMELYNQPQDIICHDHAAYILCTVYNGGQYEVVLQKLLADGTVAWPEDSALAVAGDYGENHLVNISGGLAMSWCDRTNDVLGDARLLCLDYDRHPLSGWTSQGMVVADGAATQSVHRVDVTPNGELLLAVIETDFDQNNYLSFRRYNIAGSLVGQAPSFGQVALESSPVDICWSGDTAIVTWVSRDDFYNHSVRTQKLSPQNIKLWPEDGNVIFYRSSKQLRCDIEKPDNSPARVVLLSGRSIAQPESLFIGELNNNGALAAPPENFSGGITYDIFDPRVARIAESRFAVVWSDSRESTERDIYFQFVNGEGQAELEPEGVKLSESELSIQFSPAICADGSGGAYIAWSGDSLGVQSILEIQHISSIGAVLWNEPRRLYSSSGFFGDLFLMADNSGGVFVTYSKFSDGFVTGPNVARLTSSGDFVWSPHSVEFNGTDGTDLTINSAISDGAGGVMLTCMSGIWTNYDITLFHLSESGTPGSGWTWNGRTFGTPLQERYPQLAKLGNGILLTYESEKESGGLYDIAGVLYGVDGSQIWSESPKILTPDTAQVIGHKLSEDGTGGFLLAWEDYRSDLYARAYSARFNNNGDPLWSNTERLVCDQDLEVTHTTLTHDNSGGAWMMWEDYRNSDDYAEIDLFATHLDGASGNPVTANGFSWPSDGYPICDVPTYARNPVLLPWLNGSALAVWIDLRSSNPGRCCGAGSVGDIFQNIYGQVLSEFSLSSEPPQTIVPSLIGIQSIYPNPFNPETTIQFSLPHNSLVELSIYNLLGQKVSTLVSSQLTAGVHEISWNAESNSSGIYFAKLETMNQTSVKKLVVMK